MGLDVPPELAPAIAAWRDLSRWEKAELGRDLRRRGWSYGEIATLLPVSKGTLAGWCRGIVLSPEQGAAIQRRTGSRKGVPRDTQRKRCAEVRQIREDARSSAAALIAEPLWVAGVVLYWAEGSKTERRLEMANSDPRALRLFIGWTLRYHQPDARFVLMLHLHAGNNEAMARSHWRELLGLPRAEFHKTFIKPPGTGHRKNSLPHGVCRVNVRRSTDSWHRTMEWIDVLALLADSGRLLSSPAGR